MELTTDQKVIMGRATYLFMCRLREERPEAWKKVQERAQEIATRETKKKSTSLLSAV